MLKQRNRNQFNPLGILGKALADGVEKFVECAEKLNEAISANKNIEKSVTITAAKTDIKTISFPSLLYSSEIQKTMQKIPDVTINQLISKIGNDHTPCHRTYEQVLRYYTKRSSKTFKLSIADSMISTLRKLLESLIDGFEDFNYNFHIQTAYFAYLWTAMIISLKKVHGNSWSSIIVSKMAIAVLVAIIQGIHKEFIISKSISIGYSAYGSLGDLIEKAPNDIKQALPSFLQADNYPTWHRELSANADMSDLSMAMAINMLYTFRIGDVFVSQLVSNDKYSDEILHSVAYSLSPIPVQSEQYKLVRLFPDGKLY